ncbi:MAG: BON domain-containing protein [Candidatus Eremiobacteraeota bacterium]|nr:BON domain-containing protein [Candidatus Eremiobacteraeota bacterium]
MIRGALCIGTVLLCACSGTQQKQTQQSLKSDVLATEVAAKLATVNVDSATSVHVDANGSTVTLTGEARTAQDRSNYDAAARSVSGVTEVVDHVAINANARSTRQTLADAALAAKVAGAIAAQAGVNVLHIRTMAVNNVVTLTGTVPTAALKQTVLAAAKSAAGGARIVDGVSIGR